MNRPLLLILFIWGGLIGAPYIAQAQLSELRKDLADALTAEQRLDALLALGNAYLEELPDSAFRFAVEARSLAHDQNRLSDEAEATWILGEVEAHRNNFSGAEANYRGAVQQYIAMGELMGQARCYFALGQLYGKQAAKDSADLYFSKALDFYDHSADAALALDIHFEYAELLRTWERYTDARAQCNKALDLAQSNRDQERKAEGHLLQGRIYRDWGKQDLSLNQFRQALVLFERQKNSAGEAAALKGLAQIQLNRGKTRVALDYAEQGLKKARSSGAAAEAMDLYGILSELMVQKKDYEKAIDYNQLQEMLRDSLLGAAASGDLASIVNKYEKEKLQLENEKAAQENELKAATIALQEQTIKAQRTQFYAILGGLILMGLLGTVLIVANIQRKRANKKLAAALADLQRTQTQLIRSEKLASLGQVTAGIAHEIRNPLNFVNNLSQLSVGMVEELNEELDLLKGQPFEGEGAEIVDEYFEDIRENAVKINSHGKRATRIVQDMLAHAGNGEQPKSPTNLNELVEEYMQMAFHGLKGRRPDFECDLEFVGAESLAKVEVISADLGRALLNLFSNAFEAIYSSQKEAGKVSAKIEAVGKGARITISDNGTGIAPEHLSQIFDPFFTTKPPNEGTGLGLSLAHETIVKAHQGSLNVDSKLGEGTSFTIELPG